MSDTPLFYGFTESEWIASSETFRRGVREWAHDKALANITSLESEAYIKYKTEGGLGGGHVAVFDSIYGPKYKYKAFFQSIQNARNADNFAYAEGELNAETSARYVEAPKIENFESLPKVFTKSSNSYSGCDIIPSITVGGKTFVIGNLSAISYSIHRDKVPVRTLGRTYAKSYVSGGATIAGTLVFTVFDTHVLDEVRKEVVSEVQAAGGQSSPLTQQLPPFDVTIFFQNEYGHASYMRIYGLEVTDEAQTHSINDIYTENQMQYVARDIDLMCKVGSQFTPQALAGSNETLFTQYNMATPGYKLQHIRDNDKQVGELQVMLAKYGYDITKLTTKIAELNKSAPSAENTNLINAYTIQKNALESARAGKEKQIASLQAECESLKSSESAIDDASVALGSNFSAGRDDPYALTRGVPLKGN